MGSVIDVPKLLGSPYDDSGHRWFAPGPVLPGRMEEELAISRVSSSDFLGRSRFGYLENPDDLVTRKTLSVYETMGRDDQVHAVYTLKRHARLSTGWDIVPASKDAKDMEIASFVQYVFGQMRGTVEQKLYEIMSALQYGFSITEKVWTLYDSGPFKEKVGLLDLKTRSPFGFRFILDQHGNILPNGLLQFPFRSIGDDGLPLSKMVHFPYNQEFSNPYGKSDFRGAYRSWFSKDFTYRYMNVYIERLAVPPALFKIPDNIDPSEVAKLQTFAENWQSMAAGTIPSGVDLAFPQNQWGGANSFQFDKVITLHNNAISRAFLMPDLLGFTQARGPSSGLGAHQSELFFMVLTKLGTDLEEAVLGEQVIKPLVDLNYPNVTNYPAFRFRSISGKDSLQRAQIVQLMVASGVVGAEEPWLRPYLDFPNAAENVSKSEVFSAYYRLYAQQGVKLRTMVCPFCGEPCGERFVLDTSSNVPYHEECRVYLEESTAAEPAPGRLKRVTLTEEGPQPVEDWVPPKQRRSKLVMLQAAEAKRRPTTLNPAADVPDTDKMRETTFIERGLAADQILETTNKLHAATMQQSDKIFTAIQKSIKSQVTKLKILTAKDPSKLERIKVNIDPFRKLLNQLLVAHALNGQVFALRELEIKARTKFAAEDENPEVPSGVLNDTPIGIGPAASKAKKAEADIGGNRLHATLPQTLQDFFDRKSHRLAEVERARIRDGVIELLENFTRRGDSAQANAQMAEFFDQWVRSKATDKAGAARVDAIVRTGMMDAFNDARRELYEDPDLEDFVVGYQWSAIIDTRTTRYCRAMDTKVFRKEVLRSLFPPAHWNCRSIVIPVFAGEDFTYTTVSPLSPRLGVRRQPGFAECHEGEELVLYTEEEWETLLPLFHCHVMHEETVSHG